MEYLSTPRLRLYLRRSNSPHLALQPSFLAKNVSAGTFTVTPTWSSGTPASVITVLLDYGGVDANPLDVTIIGTGTGTAMSSGSVSTTAANDLLVGFGVNDTGTSITVGTNYVSRVVSPAGAIPEDRSVTSTGSYSATATTVSADWYMQLITLKWGTQPAVVTCVPSLTLLGVGGCG